MKAFLEEYGLVIVGVIVVAALVIVATLGSRASKKSMASTFNTFISIGEGQVEGAATGVAISSETGNHIAEDDLQLNEK